MYSHSRLALMSSTASTSTMRISTFLRKLSQSRTTYATMPPLVSCSSIQRCVSFPSLFSYTYLFSSPHTCSALCADHGAQRRGGRAPRPYSSVVEEGTQPVASSWGRGWLRIQKGALRIRHQNQVFTGSKVATRCSQDPCAKQGCLKIHHHHRVLTRSKHKHGTSQDPPFHLTLSEIRSAK